jgi:hypothetical protein
MNGPSPTEPDRTIAKNPLHAKRLAALNERRGSVAMGARKDFTAKVRGLVEVAGNEVREAFAAPEMVQLAIKTIREGMEVRDRTCVNLYFQTMKMVGEDRRITVEFIHSLGAKDESELKRYVDAAKSVEGAGPRDGAMRCAEFLRAYFDVNPQDRTALAQLMGLYAPVEQAG